MELTRCFTVISASEFAVQTATGSVLALVLEGQNKYQYTVRLTNRLTERLSAAHFIWLYGEELLFSLTKTLAAAAPCRSAQLG